MKRIALVLLGFVAGAAAMLALVDRLFGGHGPRLEWSQAEHRAFVDRWHRDVDRGPEHMRMDDEPGGGWER